MDINRLTDYYNALDRARFVPEQFIGQAGEDRPLPIGYEQTISQPSLVLEMTRLLSPEPTSRVLEIGTGSGFQTALLAYMAAEVYTVERIEALQLEAKERLTDLGFENVRYHVGDGSEGWPEESPFDRIMVTAAAAELPGDLLAQLAPGGRMVIPVGPVYSQELLVVRKEDTGDIVKEVQGSVRFVELVGRYGWR